MPNDQPSRKDDLDKARVIVGEYGLLIGPAGKQSETVAQAVADGIALGRKEALAIAAEAVQALFSRQPQRHIRRLIHVNARRRWKNSVSP